MSENNSKIPTSIQRVPIETVNAIRAAATESGTSVSDVIRAALDAQLTAGTLPPGVRNRPQSGERDDLTVRLSAGARERIDKAAAHSSHTPAQWRVLALMAVYQPEVAVAATPEPESVHG